MTSSFMDTGLFLVVPRPKGKTFVEKMATVAEPFERNLWYLIFVLAFWVGLVFFGLEGARANVEGDFTGGADRDRGWGRTRKGLQKNLGKTTWLSLGSVSGAHYHQPATDLGRIFSVFYSVVCVIIIAAYTASLSAFLTDQARQ